MVQQGQLTDATTCFRQAAQLVPDDPGAHYNLGVTLARQQQPDEAISCFRRALQLDPQHFDAGYQLANLLLARGRLDEAERQYRHLLSLQPDHAGALNNLGNALRDQERTAEAADCYRRAIALDPQSALACNNLGVALMNLDQVDEALACYDQALRLNPGYADPYANRATAYLMQYRLQDALAECDQAIQIDPKHAAAHHNRYCALLFQGRFAEAVEGARRTVELNPDDGESHYRYSMVLLLVERFADAWQEYEWRWKQPGHEEQCVPAPRWRGGPLAGQTILVWTEQGYGDSLQFIRYVQLVKQQGATVIVECEDVLARIFATCTGVDRVVVRGEALPPLDLHVPLMSLPLIFRTSLDTIPTSVPYLAPQSDAVSRWRAELAADASLKIGIVWRGNPRNLIDRRRSIPLEHFAPLAQVPGVRLYSLQLGPARDELAHVGPDWPVTDLADRLVDFHETAAVMRNLDLVITCDSSPCHLAGALGVPVWVGVSYPPDWRWMLDREDSPWYPTMRLFRQKAAGNWQDVLARMADELATKIGPQEGRDRPVR